MKYLILALFSLSSFANPSQDKIQFCNDRTEKEFVKELARNEINLMSFRNHGGIRNGGVCWWHSRFQRNALYLTYYNPSAPKPDLDTARKLIRNIRNAAGVIEIPGFANFREFSIEFENEIQRELEKWQKFEGVRFAWIRGLRGSNSVSADWLQKLMDDLYEEVETNNTIAYQKLQMSGLTAHAWLVISMKKFDNGYDLEVLDSNYPYRTSLYQYRIGDNNFKYAINGTFFVPYLENKAEMSWLKETIQKNCSPQVGNQLAL